MKKILAIIVTYNRKALLQQCIAALKAQSISTFDILIIDNCSSDGTKDYLQKLTSSHSLFTIFSDQNVGGAGGFYIGIQFALKNNYTHIWLMDDDTLPYPNALEELLTADEKLVNYGFLVSLPIWLDNSICKMNRPRLDSIFDDNAEFISNGYLSVKNATFVSMMLKAETIKEMGLPIKEFFIWGDDWEYTERISQKYKNYVVLSSKTKHLMKSNVGSDLSSDDADRISRYYYAYRNELYIAQKKGIVSIFYYFFRSFYMLLKILIYAPNNKLNRIKCLFQGMFHGLFFHPSIEYTS